MVTKEGYKRKKDRAPGDDDKYGYAVDPDIAIEEEGEEEEIGNKIDLVDPTNVPLKRPYKSAVVNKSNMNETPIIAPVIRGSSMQARQGGSLDLPYVHNQTTFWEKNPQQLQNNKHNMSARPSVRTIRGGNRGK